MAATVNQLAQDALTLSDQERAKLAHKLLISLDGVPDNVGRWMLSVGR